MTQQIAAQHVSVIHVPHAQRGCAGAAVLLAILGSVGAAVAGVVISLVTTVATVVPQVSFNAGPAATPAGQGVPAVTPQSVPTPDVPSGRLVEEDYFADATRVKARYAGALGQPILAKQLVIYQYYAILEAQNPKKREHVDSYKLWANKVERPEPVRLGSDTKQIGALLFSLDDVDFKLLPRLIKQSLTELSIEEGKVTHVFLEREGSGAPLWRVYVNGSRASGFIEFSVKGEKRRVAQ